MCETKMKNYDIALTGYEFMALYHPDAEQRILASWDYEDIDELIGEGGGGAVSSYKLQVTSGENDRFEALNELREFKRLNKKIKDDPILKKMKKRYEKTVAINKERQEKVTNSNASGKLDGYQRQEQSEKLISRAKDNILRSKFLSKEEKEVRRMEDMRILFGEDKTQLQSDNTNVLQPETFSLSQLPRIIFFKKSNF